MVPIPSDNLQPTVKAAYRINLRKLNAFLFVTLVVGAATYFLTTNHLSTSGFKFKDLKQQANALSDENGRLESRVTELASYQNLNPHIQSLGLVASSNIAYISWDSHVVARR